MVEVEGHPMRVVSAGLDTRDPQQPVVVFESGAGTVVRRWDPILSSVASFAPVVAYDRSGIGESPWNSLDPTPRQVATTLRSLLSELGVAPPYVLVGHSWGGPLIRYFAGMYPDEVVGMVYIDPTDFMWTPANERALFQSLAPGADWSEYDEAQQQMQAEALARIMTPGGRAGYSALFDFRNKGMEERGLPPAPNVPTSVISAARRPAPSAQDLPFYVPFDLEAYWNGLRDTRDANLRSWVRGRGEFVEASTTEHFVHHHEPQAVVDMIRRITLGAN
jgi:pimeloyl-ACP methyl ester carboxylesterase